MAEVLPSPIDNDSESKALMKCISGLQNELAQVKTELHLCLANQQVNEQRLNFMEEHYQKSKADLKRYADWNANKIQVPRGLKVLLPVGNNVFSDISVDAEAYSFASKNYGDPGWFVMHILTSVFTYEELMYSNITGEEANHKYRNGYVGTRLMKKLDEKKLDTIIACAQTQFLEKMSSDQLREKMTFKIDGLQVGAVSENDLKIWLRAGVDFEKYIRLCHLDQRSADFNVRMITRIKQNS